MNDPFLQTSFKPSTKRNKLHFANDFFEKKNFEQVMEYEKGFKIDELFPVHFSGIETEKFLTGFRKNEIRRDDSFDEKNIQKITFHPFDDRYIYGDEQLIGPAKKNIFLVANDQPENDIQPVFWISKNRVARIHFSDKLRVFPLYLFQRNDQLHQQTSSGIPNLKAEIVQEIASRLGLSFTPEKEKTSEGEVCFLNSAEVRPEFRLTFAPIDILDYIYAVVQSKRYQENKNLNANSFVTYPKAADFWKLVESGAELRQIHLLECAVVNHFITQFPVAGNHLVQKVKCENEKVFINEMQYFDRIPSSIWNFRINEYQPAQQWLNDRKGRNLDFDDIHHYQKIMVALSETERIRKKIEELI